MAAEVVLFVQTDCVLLYLCLHTGGAQGLGRQHLYGRCLQAAADQRVRRLRTAARQAQHAAGAGVYLYFNSQMP